MDVLDFVKPLIVGRDYTAVDGINITDGYIKYGLKELGKKGYFIYSIMLSLLYVFCNSGTTQCFFSGKSVRNMFLHNKYYNDLNFYCDIKNAYVVRAYLLRLFRIIYTATYIRHTLSHDTTLILKTYENRDGSITCHITVIDGDCFDDIRIKLSYYKNLKTEKVTKDGRRCFDYIQDGLMLLLQNDGGNYSIVLKHAYSVYNTDVTNYLRIGDQAPFYVLSKILPQSNRFDDVVLNTIYEYVGHDHTTTLAIIYTIVLREMLSTHNEWCLFDSGVGGQ